MIQFLYPGVLWGLLAVSIPLIIHLFNFRRTKKIYFSNVAFLKSVETSTSAFRKLRERLLLATRMLLIAALVLAFAQPFIPAKNKANDPRQLVVSSLYIDNSMSMQNTSANKNFLDLAVIKTDELLGLFKQLPTIQLLTNDFGPADQQITSAANIRERLTRIKYSPNARTFSTILQRQKSLIYKFNAQAAAQLFWISDFQRSTSGNLRELKIDPTDRLYLVPVVGSPSPNVYVDSVWLATPIVRQMQHSLLYVKLRNSGKNAVQNLPVRLNFDGSQASMATVSIPPDAAATASFNFTVRGRGVHRGKIEFDDQPITFDNAYYFTINASPKVRVMHLAGQQAPNQYLPKVFANDSLFTFQSLQAANFNLAQLKNADLVVVEGVPQLEGSVQQSLQQFVRSGGSLVVIPSAQTQAASWQPFLSSLGVQGLNIRPEPVKPESRVPLELPNRSNPIFADVFEQAMPKGDVDVPKVQPYWSWSGTTVPLLKLRNGQPLLTETKVQQGKLYVLAMPLLPAFGNFAEHAFFVPTMYKLAWFSLKAERPAYNFSEQTIRLPLASVGKEGTYTLKNGDIELIPGQRLQGNTLLLDLPKAADLADNQRLVSGYYELKQNGQTLRTLALNHDNEESVMDTYSVAELKDTFRGQPNVTVFDDLLAADFVKGFAATNFGQSLWKYFLYAALFFLLAEIFIIRYWKRKAG